MLKVPEFDEYKLTRTGEPYILKEEFSCKLYICEPGDCTRYNFYAINTGYEFLLSSTGLSYPDVVPHFILKVTVESACRWLRDEYPDVNPYTIWVVVELLREELGIG
jgi:hypothetical protein